MDPLLSKYNIFCSIKIGQDEKIFMINKVFLGKNRREAFYLVDELDTQDMMIMKYNLLRVYPSSKLGIHKHHNQIVLDASAVFINEYFIDGYTFNSDDTGYYAVGDTKMEFTYEDNGNAVKILYTGNTMASTYEYKIEGTGDYKFSDLYKS